MVGKKEAQKYELSAKKLCYLLACSTFCPSFQRTSHIDNAKANLFFFGGVCIYTEVGKVLEFKQV
jgi:hypothetical protein